MAPHTANLLLVAIAMCMTILTALSSAAPADSSAASCAQTLQNANFQVQKAATEAAELSEVAWDTQEQLLTILQESQQDYNEAIEEREGILSEEMVFDQPADTNKDNNMDDNMDDNKDAAITIGTYAIGVTIDPCRMYRLALQWLRRLQARLVALHRRLQAARDLVARLRRRIVGLPCSFESCKWWDVPCHLRNIRNAPLIALCRSLRIALRAAEAALRALEALVARFERMVRWAQLYVNRWKGLCDKSSNGAGINFTIKPELTIPTVGPTIKTIEPWIKNLDGPPDRSSDTTDEQSHGTQDTRT